MAAVAGCGATSTESFENYIGSADWQHVWPGTQTLLVASDPQPFRVMTQREPYEEAVNKNLWLDASFNSFVDFIKQKRSGSSSYVPLLVNGDMTDYGHGDERSAMRERMKKMPSSMSGPLMLPGLGNHDYDQNVDNCANNGCARDAVCDHITWVKAIQGKARNFNFDYSWNASSKTHTGSLAYSLDFGKVHVVQLNLSPTYTRSFSTGIADKVHFNITASLQWLERDLRAAKARGQYTIINLHKSPGQQAELIRMMEANNVVAVFVGHLHRKLGREGSIGKIPLFYSGGILAKTFLKVDFPWPEHRMVVTPYVGTQPQASVSVNLPGGDQVPPVKALSVTIYERGFYEGRSCSFTVESGKNQGILDATGCAYLVAKPQVSLRISDFDGASGMEACLNAALKVICFNGSYSGSFAIPNLLDTTPPNLPSGLRAVRYTAGFGGITRVSYAPR